MTTTPLTLTRRGALGAAGAAGLRALLAACADTGADGKAVSTASGSGSGADYLTAVTSGPVATADVVAASTWASAVKQAGTLRIGGTRTSLVFSQEDPATKKVTGFDAALSQALARYVLGGDDPQALVEITQATSDTRETLIQNGTVDAVFATYTITPERAQKISFAGPYYASGQAILVKSDNSTITGVESLTADVKVAVQSGSSSGPALAKAGSTTKPIEFEDDSKCVAALQANQVDAYVVDQALLLSHVATNSDLKIVGEPFTTDPYGIGLPKDSDAQSFVNTFLRTIEDDGTWKRIWEATIGKITGGTAPTPPEIGSVPGSQAATPQATDSPEATASATS